MSGAPLLPVAEALARVLASAPTPLPSETVSLHDARGRTLAEDVAALRTQPPFPASAMDGYAVRAADIAEVPASLAVIGASAAGHRFTGSVGAGQAVRIFTGAPVPDGADTILIQENTRAVGDVVVALESETLGRYVRRAGLDFSEGDVLLAKGRKLGPPELALAAAMNHPTLPVTRKPRVALLATGDELVRPGESLGPDQIVASNTYAVAAYAEAAGAEVIDLGIAGDRFADLEASIRAARDSGADVLVTLGGASVGDHDLVQTALAREGMELGFWRIAMRPGKPLMHGRIGDMRILGLPGNPVSAIVCGVLFLVPLVRALSGDPSAAADRSEIAVLGGDLPANDSRQDYLRAHITGTRDGHPLVEAFSRQDSSMLRVLAEAECLIVRDPYAPAAGAGEACRMVRL
ncbi:MAG: molybdenum cofactor biosynthesis protein MoaA [Hyphomicrobiales bacterium]|nr:molybdenum cofactor biosynthesis protein MoaA [Hyphomicrobiales bacterium]